MKKKPFWPDITFAIAILAVTTYGFSAPKKASPPTLFFDLEEIPQIKARMESSVWLSESFASVINQADALLAVETQPYSLSNHGTVGKGSEGRPIQSRFATLALVGYVKGEQKYLDKGKDVLLAVVHQTEPDTHKHWLQHLQSADASQALAYGYDFFGHLLSPNENTEVRDYLNKIGSLLVHEDTTWGKPAPGVMSCNHNSVHHGALGLIALVLGDKPQWLDIARARVRGYFETFTDATGYATEGHNYFGYGLTGAYPFSYALQRATGEALWDTQPAMHLVGDQIVWGLLPFDGRMVPIGDNGVGPTGEGGIIPALMNNNGVQLWAWLNSHPDYNDGLVNPQGKIGTGLAGHLLFLAGNQAVEPTSPAAAGVALGHQFESGRVFLRSSWEGEDAAHVSFVSGYDFHRGHNHKDENSLTFAALGEAFIIDPGYGLNSPELTEHHTLITVNGVGQIKGGPGRIVAYREDEFGAMVRGQAEEAYDFDAALVGMADRKMYFVRGPHPYLIWRDDIALESDANATFVSYYISDVKNKLSQQGDSVRIEGYRGKASCMLQVFAEGERIKVSVEDLTQKTFPIRGGERPLGTHLSRASATWVGHNPRLLSIALPFQDPQDLPEVTVDFDPATDELTCTLSFSEGNVDVLVFGLNNATLKRL